MNLREVTEAVAKQLNSSSQFQDVEEQKDGEIFFNVVGEDGLLIQHFSLTLEEF